MVSTDIDDPVVQAVFERSQATNGRIGNLYRVLANAPALLDAWVGFAWRLRAECTTARDLRELLIMRVGQLTRASYEWQQHWPMALAAGVSEDKLRALADWRAASVYSPIERAGLAMADELTTDGSLTDATYGELARFVEHDEMIELVLTVAFYNCVSRVLLGIGVPLEDRPLPAW